MNEALDFPLPPTTGSYEAEAPLVAPAAAPPATAPPTEADELTVLREKVAELERIVALAKTRVETLGAEKRAALERAFRAEEQLEAAQRGEAKPLGQTASPESPRAIDERTVAELLNRVAALEAIVAPSRAA